MRTLSRLDPVRLLVGETDRRLQARQRRAQLV
jgi:hypothetical protein